MSAEQVRTNEEERAWLAEHGITVTSGTPHEMIGARMLKRVRDLHLLWEELRAGLDETLAANNRPDRRARYEATAAVAKRLDAQVAELGNLLRFDDEIAGRAWGDEE